MIFVERLDFFIEAKMFSTFTGDYKKQKTVNLGGATAHRQDREALLKKAQLDRLNRELERKRVNCAFRIQVEFFKAFRPQIYIYSYCNYFHLLPGILSWKTCSSSVC